METTKSKKNRQDSGATAVTTEGGIISASKKRTFSKLIDACKRKDLVNIRSMIEQNPSLLYQRDKHHRNLLHYLAILVVDEEQTQQKSTDGDLQQQKCLECFEFLQTIANVYMVDNEAQTFWCQNDLDKLTVLHFAVISCNVSLVRYILFHLNGSTSSRLVEALDSEHHSPLHWAVITNNLECVKLLIEHSGVELVHVRDQNGATSLHYATQTNDYPKYRAQLRQMLKNATSSHPLGRSDVQQSKQLCAGVSLDAGDSLNPNQDKSKNRASVDVKSSLEVLSYLVSLDGINLECLDNDRRTPLLWAASSGNWDAIVLLANAGANLLARDASSLGALHCSASHGFTECLESLLRHPAQCSGLPLNGDSESLSDRTNQADILNCTPLFYAVLSGNIDCIELLLDRGAQFDWQDFKGRTAAHFAALRGQLNSLKLLESRGANLWLATKQGDLPLHYAVKSGRQQVIAWLLERSPYERAVNAINNTGRAPIHLAVMKNNAALAEWLIEKHGANVNQLVKMRDKSTSTAERDVTTPAGSVYKYETALDMANRLKNWTCLELLERHGARSAAKVLAMRKQLIGPNATTSSPYASKTTPPMTNPTASSSTSAEPQQFDLPRANLSMADHRSVPKMPARPAALNSQIPQTSDSSAPSGSSSLSQSSTTSIRGVNSMELPPLISSQATQGLHQQQQSISTKKSEQQKQFTPSNKRSASGNRPYKGGISYHNDHINASIKCKLYRNLTGQQDDPGRSATNGLHQHSFPPLNLERGATHRSCHSSSSLDRVTSTAAKATDGGAGGGQEIVTNVNVYTSPCVSHCSVHQRCEQCDRCQRESLHQQRKSATRRQFAVSASESDSDATTSGTSAVVLETDQRGCDDEFSLSETEEIGKQRLPVLPNGQKQPLNIDHPGKGQVPASHHQMRFTGSANHDNYSSQLPVILSAEEERSTSGETMDGNNNLIGSIEKPLGAALCDEEPRFDRSNRASTRVARSRYRSDQVRSPVAEYINSQPVMTSRDDRRLRSSSHENWQHPVRTDYSHVKPRVDSHRNDSGLSSAFGFANSTGEIDSPAGRRSKSLSTSSQLQQCHNVGRSPQHQTATPPVKRPDAAQVGFGHSRSCSRQTIIKTRRLSVDSVELASRVEKSIRKYKQETKLFEELQNLKRSQIRSGRANEALQVKRLVDQFKSDKLDSLLGLDNYVGPYTFKAYELYLYDQLRKLSQSNHAKLDGNILAHKFNFGIGQKSGDLDKEEELADEAEDGGRDYLDEDLKAELELQRVINSDTNDDAHGMESEVDQFLKDTISIEPSGALEEIRVKQQDGHDAPKFGESTDEVKMVERAKVHQSQDSQSSDVASTIGREEPQAETEPPGRSSTSLSRRSSVVEREKSPMRVVQEALSHNEQADQQEERELSLEDQAISLSSAILTDALGNISRTGSLTGEGSTDNREGNNNLQTSSVHKAEETADQQAESSDASVSVESTPPPSPVGRRRSVVNIGSKMEVIYHKVGIEIEPVKENGCEEDLESSVAEEKVTTTDECNQNVASSVGDADGSIRDRPDPVRGDPQERSNFKQQLDSGRKIIEPSSRVILDEDDHSCEEPDSSTRTMKCATPMFLRRASSPPSHLRAEKQSGSSKSIQRRSSAIDNSVVSTSDLGQSANQKRVFTGHDIDEFHSKKLSGRLMKLVDTQTETNSSLSQQNASQPTVTRCSPTYKRHLKRSRPPAKPLKLKLPLEEIRARWNGIKRLERLKMRRMKANHNVLPIVPHASSTTKSQPNLDEQQERSEDWKQQEHFVLIYELRKGSTEWALTDKQEDRRLVQSTSQWWCQKKITQVIDVRTLRRTLSLPESIMYSNELFKKFNVLKL